MQTKLILKLLTVSFFAIYLISCGSSGKPENQSAAQVYADGVKYFNDEDYEEAKKYFELIKLQYPASEYADDAQYYMAELYFHRKEFILSAFTFNNLRKIYPGSEYTQEALYKTALCYYELSPKFDRDQDYTKQAIQTFQDFQYLYPDDSLATLASSKIEELREKLAHKEYFTAELYMNMDYPQSAVIYFESVINNYDDTSYLHEAFKGKVDALIYMEKIDEAKETIRIYKNRFPNGKYYDDVSNLQKSLE